MSCGDRDRAEIIVGLVFVVDRQIAGTVGQSFPPGRRLIELLAAGTAHPIALEVFEARSAVAQEFGLVRDAYRRHDLALDRGAVQDDRSEEHTSELQSLMRISY